MFRLFSSTTLSERIQKYEIKVKKQIFSKFLLFPEGGIIPWDSLYVNRINQIATFVRLPARQAGSGYRKQSERESQPTLKLRFAKR
jgi:hypothetical protein